MADEVDASPNKTNTEQESKNESKPEDSLSSSDDSDSESDSSSDSDSSEEPDQKFTPRTREISDEYSDSDDSPDANVKRFMEILNSRWMKKARDEEDRENEDEEELFDFPRDPENWREEDLKELWADAPLEMTKPGWDPAWVDEDEVEVIRDEIKAGREPPIAPFYVPYRKPYPVIPDNHHDISNPKSVIEELDRIEEFLTWVSYIFPDGST